MASILDYGAGAYNGTRILQADREKAIEDARQQAILDENHRANLAHEDFQNRNLDENSKFRILQQQELDQNRRTAAEDRDSSRAIQTVNLRPIGAPVSPEEYARETQLGIPKALYDVKDDFGLVKDQTGNPEDQGPTLDRSITNKGTASNLFSAERIADAETRARNAEQAKTDALSLAQQRESRINSWGPPTVVIAGPDGMNQVVPRGQVKDGAPAPLPSPVIQQEIGNEVSEGQLDQLEKMFPKVQNKIGPVAGRANTFGQKVPGLPVDTDYANFEASSSAFRNAVIKAITGAQMSEVEANRIRQQIPEVTDKPEVWKAKAAQTRINLQMLKGVLGKKQPGGGPAPAPHNDADPLGLLN